MDKRRGSLCYSLGIGIYGYQVWTAGSTTFGHCPGPICRGRYPDVVPDTYYFKKATPSQKILVAHKYLRNTKHYDLPGLLCYCHAESDSRYWHPGGSNYSGIHQFFICHFPQKKTYGFRVFRYYFGCCRSVLCFVALIAIGHDDHRRLIINGIQYAFLFCRSHLLFPKALGRLEPAYD